MSAVISKLSPRGVDGRLGTSHSGSTTGSRPVEFQAELRGREGQRSGTADQKNFRPHGPSAKVSAEAGLRMADIGAGLAGLRREIGFTQVDVAQRMGASQPAVARIEKAGEFGTDALPNLDTLQRYAHALGRDLSVVFLPGASSKAQEGLPKTVQAGGVAEALASIRKASGLMQRDIAAAMFTTQPVIARFEAAGANHNLRTLERYASALGIDLRLVLTRRSMS